MTKYRQPYTESLSDALRGGSGGMARFKMPKTPGSGGFRPGSLSGTKLDDVIQAAAHAANEVPANAVTHATQSAKSAGNNAAAVAGIGAAVTAGAVGVAALSDSEKTDVRLEKVEGALGKLGMVGWLAPGAVNLLGGGMNKIGGWTNAGWLKRAGESTQSGVKTFNTVEFGQISQKAGVGGWFTRITQPIANVAGTVTDKLTGWLGIKGWRSRANLGKAAIAHSKAADIATAMEKNLAHAPEGIRTHFQTIVDVAKAPHPSHINTQALEAATTGLQEGIQALGKNGGAISSEVKTLVSQTGKIEKHLGNSLFHMERSGSWKNAGEAVKNVPKSISGANLSHTLLNGAFVAASGVSMIRDKRSFSRDIASLKQMAKDLTGEDYSTLRLLLGSVPKPIADVRWKVAGKLLAMETADAGNIAIQLSRRVGPMGSIVSMMGVMALSGVASTALSTDFIGVYKAFSEAHKKGTKLSQEEYAQFLALTSNDLKNRGAEDPAVQALAAKYAEQNLAPVDIVKRASSTQLMADLHEIIKANEAKAPSHVDKLNGGTKAAQPVMGAHTAKVAAQTQTAPEQGRVV